MKWKQLLLIFPLITMLSCDNNNELKTKCPLGAPSLAFYNQGNNSNFVTINGSAQIIAEFQQNKYDALVVDATSGLKQIKTYKDTPFRLAKLITSGNLYLTSFKHNVNTETPKNGETILTFGSNNSIPYLVSNKLKVDKWNNCNLNSLNDVSLVLSAAKYDLEKDNPENDYYVIAEPALTSLKAAATSKSKNITSIKLSSPTLLNSKIPQAALFINKNSYYKKKDKFTEYLNNLKTNITNCINNPTIVKNTLDSYGDDSIVSQKFGFKSNVVSEVQKDGNNGFAFNLEKFTYSNMNDFMNTIGLADRYVEEDFLNVD